MEGFKQAPVGVEAGGIEDNVIHAQELRQFPFQFLMDRLGNLKGVCDLADEFDALVMVDDSHATGFMGDTGRGTPEFCGVRDRVDIITGTFGKALGGASGGFTAARQEIVDLLRQRSRPYLFSNTVAPAICAATIKTSFVCPADTWVRILAFPWGTTG